MEVSSSGSNFEINTRWRIEVSRIGQRENLVWDSMSIKVQTVCGVISWGKEAGLHIPSLTWHGRQSASEKVAEVALQQRAISGKC